MGMIFLGVAMAIWVLFGRETEPGLITTFLMAPGGQERAVAPLLLPSLATLNMLALASAFVGAGQLARGFGRYTNLMLGLVVGLFIISFLTWAASGQSLNLVGLLNTSLSRAVPITLGALSGVLCERAGVVNIAIEGMMLFGALSATVGASLTGNLWMGVLAGVATGALLALVHALFSIRYMVDQIVSGTVINIFSVGMTSYISSKFLRQYDHLNNPGTFRPFAIPVLSDIPVLGPILFNNNMFVYAMFALLFLLHFGLYYTRWGLRLRSVGEHPKAADTLGINVFRTRYMAVTLGGMMAGFGGAFFSLGSVGRFDEVMTAGRGFIGLAAMIFGNWNPFGAFGAGLLFGFADSLQSRIAILGIPIPSQFLLMVPYIATMIVLAGVVGRGEMPAADGQPYKKEG
jgi:simple sugar transport system permease protein